MTDEQWFPVPNTPTEPPPKSARSAALEAAIAADTDDEAQRILTEYGEAAGYKPGWAEKMGQWVRDKRQENTE